MVFCRQIHHFEMTMFENYQYLGTRLWAVMVFWCEVRLTYVGVDGVIFMLYPGSMFHVFQVPHLDGSLNGNYKPNACQVCPVKVYARSKFTNFEL